MSKTRLLTQDEANEYKEFLEGYQPSADTVYKFARSNFGVIAGPTGVGKDTLRNQLTVNPEFTPILSTTTRPSRSGEADGVQYHFRDIKFIDEGFEERRFLQAEVVHDQQVSCLDITEIEKLNDQQVGLSILIVQTEVKLRQLNRDMMTVFIVPPNLDELERRITSSRDMQQDEILRRMHAARIEFEFAIHQPHYQCVINDDISRAVDVLRTYFLTKQFNQSEDYAARQVLQTCLDQMKLRSNYA